MPAQPDDRSAEQDRAEEVDAIDERFAEMLYGGGGYEDDAVPNLADYEAER